MARRKSDISDKPLRAPAKSLEARENQLIALAYDVAEEQMRNGTASPSVITQFLRMGTTKHQLEKAKLEKENSLLDAKTDFIQSEKDIKELYNNAITAMKSYSGQDNNE